jgi:putative OPT family oligopeptide transporter
MKQEKLHQPIIAPEQSLPEITIKGTIIALVLTIILAASNTYLGLQAGITISASIPAAVMAMGLLRWFKNYNILENNIVQTCVSCGEGAAAGIIFSLPALLILHYWLRFDYWVTFTITLVSCLMGVLLTIPLRKVLLNDKALTFPEGVAIAKVLQSTTDTTGNSFKFLLRGGLVGGAIAFCQQGLQVMTDSAGVWFNEGKTIFGLSLGFSPALIAAGYIIGITAAMSMLVGIVATWIIGMPILSSYYGDVTGHGIDAAMGVWSHHIRYIGVGTLLAGGVWTIFRLTKPVILGISQAFKALHPDNYQHPVRTERDIKITTVTWLAGLLAIPVIFLVWFFMHQLNLNLSTGALILLFVVMTVLTLLLQFVISALCGYFSGLVGASSNPLSAMAISAAIVIGLILLLFLPSGYHQNETQIAGFTIILLTLATAVGGIATDSMQDLKAGHMVGATPWKQQLMLFVGVTVTALVLPLILNLLLNAYGIGGVYPHANMSHANGLPAPQATLMASIVQGVFSHNLNWIMILVGMLLAVICITTDLIISRKGYRLHTMAVGLGVYLPVMTSSCLVMGGLISYFSNRKLVKTNKNSSDYKTLKDNRQSTTILACGLIAGATLMGVILAVPFVIYKSSNALAIMPTNLMLVAKILGAVSALWLWVWLYRSATNVKP